MKKILLSLAVGALLVTAPRAANADVSVDFFYNNLSGGSWIEVSDYGYCWQPSVAVSNTSWRPYADGYWAYTDVGWTWVSYEDFGWATYHYGRWARLSDYGWVWVPGRDADLEWGPAWVSWRTGGQYIGWAPLPPETIAFVGSRPITGHIDVEFNIGPAYYNFVDVRYIGEPVLRERIYAPTQNITYIQQTVNVTNITYQNNNIYNYGPDINVVNRTAARPVQRLRLDRQQNVDVTAAAKSGALTKVQGDRLVVAAPPKVNRSAKQAAPQNIKTKVAAAKVDRGWSAVGDEKAQAEFKQRLRNQDTKTVPPPTSGGEAAQASAGSSPSTAPASPAAAASPAAGEAAVSAASNAKTQEGQARGRRGQLQGGRNIADTAASPVTSPNATGAAAQASASPADATAQEGRPGRGRGHGRNRDKSQQQGTAATGATSQPDAAAASRGAGSSSESAVSQGDESQQNGGRHARRGQGDQPAAMGQGADDQGAAPRGSARQQREGRQFRNQPAAETAPSDMQGHGRGQHRQDQGMGQGAEERHQGQKQGRGQGRGQGQGRGGQGQGEASPAPTP